MLHKFRPATINIQYVHHTLTIISLEIKNIIKYSMNVHEDINQNRKICISK